MALFEDESIEDIVVSMDETNRYLNNADSGFGLIRKILTTSPKNEDDTIQTFILQEIFPILAELKLDNELEVYKKLSVLGIKIREENRVELLKGKKILGIGGKFSAGKSCFINSITNAELPEGQRPTTSIATYIVNAAEKKNMALTMNGAFVELDDDALEALTHKFFEKYKIGFSKLVQQLIVYNPDFTYPNIAILDTPGYSKSDVNKGEDSSDAEMARVQLQSIDYLIWLVDSVQGVVTQRDLEFISTLNVDTPILFVFTKATLETKENLTKKIDQAKKVLKSCSKVVYGIMAYDSVTKETLIGDNLLEEFLNDINKDYSQNISIFDQIRTIGETLDEQISSQVLACENKIDELEQLIVGLEKVEHMDALLEDLRSQQAERKDLIENRDMLAENFEKLTQIINYKKGGI